ncbi:MAG TPA: DUF962 domain-containing protein [Terriglobales bacterium]|nr:DUF962 domain-containing protein [Terriglobales bacterium]
MEEPYQFTSYDDFFVFYLREHSRPATRYLHACGTTLGLIVAVVTVAAGKLWGILLFPLIGYGFAWFSHFVVEGNRPATLGHPWWSLMSDFRMIYLMMTGQLGKWMARSVSGSSANLPH